MPLFGSFPSESSRLQSRVVNVWQEFVCWSSRPSGMYATHLYFNNKIKYLTHSRWRTLIEEVRPSFCFIPNSVSRGLTLFTFFSCYFISPCRSGIFTKKHKHPSGQQRKSTSPMTFATGSTYLLESVSSFLRSSLFSLPRMASSTKISLNGSLVKSKWPKPAVSTAFRSWWKMFIPKHIPCSYKPTFAIHKNGSTSSTPSGAYPL